MHLSSSIFFGSFGLGHTTKINCMKLQTDDPEICFISVFKKNLGLVSSPRFVHDFSSQILSMLYSINLTNFNVCFSLVLEVSHNMFIPTVCFPVCNVKNLEIYIRFLIKFFSYRTKNSPGLNPDWFREIKLYSVKKVNNFFVKKRSKMLCCQ